MTQSTQTISPLRQRMIDDMRMRKLSPKTQTGYIRAVKRFAGFLGRSPANAKVEDLRRFQLHLVDHGVAFKWKDYRAKGKTKHKIMTLAAGEFMRRFLLHVLPRGFHRIRH